MKSMMRSMVMLSVFALASAAVAGLYWGSGNNVITDFNGDPVPTSGSFDPTVGAFAQLIRITSGSSPSDFVASGNGVSGFDQVVATVYSGLNDDLSDPGVFAYAGTTIFSGSEYNGWYYVRVFDAAQPTVDAWNLGNNAPIPTGASYYWQSATYNYTHNETEPSYFNFGSGQTTLPINTIPEPGVLALIALGLVGIRLTRKNG